MTSAGPVLRDIHVPPASWWPLAPGWWLVAGLGLLLAMIVAYWLWRRVRMRPVRSALREIDTLETAFARDQDVVAFASHASRLLRRIAVRIDPAAAATRGESWHAFLHGHTRDAGTLAVLDGLSNAPYQSHPELEVDHVLAALRAWCPRAIRARSPARDSAKTAGQPARGGLTGAR